jgi:hypothetical protein
MNDLKDIILEVCTNLIRSTEASLLDKHAAWFSVQWPNGSNSVLVSSNADAITPNDSSGNHLERTTGRMPRRRPS